MTVEPSFWLSLVQIIWIDILLSGDNALVIALACRSLPDRQRRLGIILGAGAAVALRIAFAGGIATLMSVPYLKIVGGGLLLWVAVKLMLPSEEDEASIASGANLWAAVRTIVVADAVMSLDNVIAIAAASHGDVLLLAIGLAVSIPLIVFGSGFVAYLLDRMPALVTLGGALLGWIAGDVMLADPALAGGAIEMVTAPIGAFAPAVTAIAVVVLAQLMVRRKAGREAPVELPAEPGE